MEKTSKKISKGLLLGALLFGANQINSQCTVPSLVTASPATICASSTASLNATSVGSAIKWYTVPICGVPTGTSASGADFTVSPVSTTTFYAEAFSTAVAGGSVQLNYTGCMQQITIPTGVTQLTIDAYGAQGQGPSGGMGGRAQGVLAVSPGQVLNIYVGGQSGFNGGGIGWAVASKNGGGASDVRISPYAILNRVLVAGGGGAGGPTDVGNHAGGAGGGGVVGANYAGGGAGGGYGGAGTVGGLNGGTGNVSCHSGGAGGGGFNNGGGGSCNTCYGSTCGQNGSLGQGGNGDTWENGICYTTYGGTSGGGGGYYGGGGTSVGNCGSGGGGGGSSFTGTLANPLFQSGVQAGNGKIIIHGLSGGCTSSSRTPVVVTVNPSPTVTITGGSSPVCSGSAVNLTGNGATSYSWSTAANTSTIAPTPSVSTSYTVVGTSAGCSNQAVVNVTVNPTPTLAVTGNTLICGTANVVLTASGANTYSWSTTANTSTISVSPTVTTNYTVVGTNTLGNCINTVTTSILVSTNPTLAVVGATSAVCAGSIVNLTASGANTYSWSNGPTTNTIAVTPLTNTSYTVVGTNTAGCASNAVATITVNALPTISITGVTTICKGEVSILAASGANTYSWNTGATTSSISVSPTTTIVYTATGTSSLTGCSNTATLSLVVNPCTGINEVASKISGLLIYPNPSTGEFTIELSNGLSKAIEVSDLSGRVVFTNTSSKDKVNVNITHLASGIYYVKIQSNNANEVIQILKQ